MCFSVALFLASVSPVGRAQDSPQTTATQSASRALGTVSAIDGQTITLKTDAGTEVKIAVAESTKLLLLKPGEKDLKQATPLNFSDLKVGDRILARGLSAADGKSLQATSVIAMKQADIADKQAHERAEWQRNGIGGLVKSVDPAAGLIAITTNAVGSAKDIAVHISKSTVLRRYSADSVKFDDAKTATLAEVKAGDQLRARGQKNAEGTEINADEVVSGTFRNIAGILVSADSAAGTLTVTDLATKHPVTLRITSDSQLRKLPAFMAQGIAMRLRGTPAGGQVGPPSGPPAAPNGAAGAPSAPNPGQTAAPRSGTAAGAGPGGPAPGPGQGPGSGQGFGAGQGRGGDFQQMLARMPASTLADLNKGDALMIVATDGSSATSSTVITLLAGVEPILQASSKATPDMILSPWSLGGGGGGEGATP
ncbi:MAG: hypothetical protein NVS9B14_05890 [Candidatus Acidiferrum sp.]